MNGSYIVNSAQRDGMYFTPEMSRRARVIELWATLKYLGKDGIDKMILNMCERAQQFCDELTKEGFQILNEVVFNQVLVAAESDDMTMEIMKEVQEDRVCWVGPSLWFGKKVVRISVCSWATTSRDVELSVQSFAKARKKITEELAVI